MTAGDDNLFGQEHVRAYRESNGEHGYNWRGTTILLLTTKGSRSGEERTTPLIHRTDDGNWVIVASKGGAPDHPSWYKNLVANPDDVTIQDRGEVVPVLARTAAGDERDRLWGLMTAVWPAYDEYQRKTKREIPIVVLERR
jgi:deazaflavin-dependent oxidoreductase (nitroreductase family)